MPLRSFCGAPPVSRGRSGAQSAAVVFEQHHLAVVEVRDEEVGVLIVV
jgi:hypothetical protein